MNNLEHSHIIYSCIIQGIASKLKQSIVDKKTGVFHSGWAHYNHIIDFVKKLLVQTLRFCGEMKWQGKIDL